MQAPQQHTKPLGANSEAITPISSSKALLVHLACGLCLASVFWVADNFFSLTLIQSPAQTLHILWVLEASVVLLTYSFFRCHPEKCSYVKAILRGLLGLIVGAVVNALGAIVMGAPVGFQHLRKTVPWSLLMSVFMFVPAASVFGSSWSDWHRIFAHTKPVTPIDFMICLPAHGAVIGAWFGAWPMPLDWERTWQEWPICVTYGAIIGYLAGMAISVGFVVVHNQHHRVKID